MAINKKGVFTKTIKYDDLRDYVDEGGKRLLTLYKGNVHVATINLTDKKVFC